MKERNIYLYVPNNDYSCAPQFAVKEAGNVPAQC